ncbi:MAG: dihydrofolate reductase family protein [Candidatus Omnitrophica bacterium]|nr:dihydrofolate reductase family protein [Candidatus Omnitrophota bacterium]MCB9720817.1 dihydrofolate reductase family protein [Candidatus Omnitrophota bacterium]
MAKVSRRRPFVVAKTAQTLDGKVAAANGRSQWITSSQTRIFARQRRDRFKAIMTGAETVIKDNPRLTGVRRGNLIKVVVDSTLRVSPRAKVFQLPELCWLATTRRADSKRIRRFEAMGVKVLLCPRQRGRVSLPFLFDQLARAGLDKVLIEGGPTLIGQALRDGLVDSMDIYIAPKIMGDNEALDAVVGLPVLAVNRLYRLTNLKIKRIKPDILVQGDVHRNR